MRFSQFGNGARAADPEICLTCKHRDKTTITVNDLTVNVGAKRDTCEIYVGGEKRIFKPNDVMFYNAKCKYYEKEGD